jgi:homocysteine S-methyltransferase
LKRNDIRQKFVELKRPLVLDGAMGTYLSKLGYRYDKLLWYSFLNMENPKVIKKIHEEYIDSGADIITTNTFRTNPSIVKRANLSITNYEFVKQSVEPAISANHNHQTLIAGSNAPAEDCYQIERTLSSLDLEYNHKKHIEMLWQSGVDFILNETLSHWDEIEIVVKFCNENKIPFIISLYFRDDLNILSGEPISEVIKFVTDFSPEAVSFNCVNPETFSRLFETMSIDFKYGFYFNCGISGFEENNITKVINPVSYSKIIKPFINYNNLFVGSCCGSNPIHTEKIHELIDAVY